MVWRNVQVERPRSSTSGGQWDGRTSDEAASVDSVGVGVEDDAAVLAVVVPVANAAIAAAVFEPVLELELEEALPVCLVRRTLRNAVHILQGLPSGPITQPGGGLAD